ncbi:MAG: TonB-dependent receptor, partial [Thermomicrobiales bacterium]|nr:TonB-dependent receptor [Thermomicrobiales bacterium]
MEIQRKDEIESNVSIEPRGRVMSELPVFNTARQSVAPTVTSCRTAVRTALYGAMGVILSGVAFEAMAQEDTLVEIVVTAERRAQSAQDVPIALTTFSEDQVAPAAISGLSDIALKTPSFTLTQFNIAEPQLYLRGIGSTSDSAASDPTVSVFLDEVYLGRPGSAAFDLYDLERIEVLRGPQGTLYGRNVTGGVINIYTKPPAETFEAKVGVTLGNEDLSVLRGYVSGPLTGSVRGKISVSRTDRGGYARNVDNGQELDDAHNFSARGQLVMDVSEATSLTLSADLTRDRTNGDCRYTGYLDASMQGHAFNGAFISQTLAARNQEGITNPRECGQSWTQFADRDNSGVSLRAVHDAGWAELTSITAYRKNKFEWRQELGGMDAPPAPLKVPDNEGEDSWQATQELRLGKGTEHLDWIVGAFGFRENVDRFARVPQIFGPTAPVNPGVALNRLWTQDARNTSYAAFGQATWEFVPRVSLTLGGRYTRDDKEIDQYYWQNNVVVYDLKNI